MNSKYFLSGIACLIVAGTLWQWSSSVHGGADASYVGSDSRGWKKIFKKFENTSASADDVMPSGGGDGLAASGANGQGISGRYQHYRTCMEAQTPCSGFNTSTPNAYLEDVRSQMLSELTAYYQNLKSQPHSVTSDDQTLARELVTDATPDAQIIGLEILNLVEPSELNLESITNLMKSAFDDGVVAVAGDSLLRYKDNGAYQAAITKTFLDQIGLGVNDQAALAAIEKLPPFLTSENVGEFRDLRDRLREMSERERLQTRRYKALDAVLAGK